MRDVENLRADFLSAMGEEFGALVSPPVPFLEASHQQCCEAIWLALGEGVTPSVLAVLTQPQLEQLAVAFGRWFECSPPPVMQITEAVARTLHRWPPGSLGEVA
jgi:hypothetical protein